MSDGPAYGAKHFQAEAQPPTPPPVPLFLVLSASDDLPWPRVTSDPDMAREWARRRGARWFRIGGAEEMK